MSLIIPLELEKEYASSSVQSSRRSTVVGVMFVDTAARNGGRDPPRYAVGGAFPWLQQ